MKNRDFIRVSLSEFKRRISHWFDAAEDGTTVEVTRHAHPSVRIERAGSRGLHVGERAGKEGIKPLASGHRFRGILKVLEEDREPDR